MTELGSIIAKITPGCVLTLLKIPFGVSGYVEILEGGECGVYFLFSCLFLVLGGAFGSFFFFYSPPLFLEDSGKTLEPLPVPKGAPAELQRDFAQGHEVMGWGPGARTGQTECTGWSGLDISPLTLVPKSTGGTQHPQCPCRR